MKLSLLLRNIPFEIERACMSRANSALSRRPSSKPFLSGDTFRAMANHVFDRATQLDPRLVKSGDVVFVSASRLNEFADTILPSLSTPFVLLTHQGDTNIDEQYASIANNESIIHWYAQNCLLEHPKVTPLPIGLEDRWRHNNGALRDYKRIKSHDRPSIPNIAYAFNLKTNPDIRLGCYRTLLSCKTATELPQPLNAHLYRKTIKEFMFIASPPGNGIDCHRTWESMYMHCVPVVEDNHMNRYYKSIGLPLLLIKRWEEILDWDENHLEELYRGIALASNSAPLFLDYWATKIISSKVWK